MPAVAKPNLPVLPVAELQKRIERMATALESSKGLDGSVEFRDLERHVSASRDPHLSQLFEHLRDRFELHARPNINPDETTLSYPRVDTSLMKPADVDAMAAALDRAKGRVQDFDVNADGQISWNEGSGRLDSRNDANDIANVVVHSPRASAQQELSNWVRVLVGVSSSIEARGITDRHIERSVGSHVQTPQAAEALAWAYREQLVDGSLARWAGNVDGELRGAESSFLAKIPLFGGLATRGKHLDDSEVKSFLGTSDLAAFTAEKKAAVEAKSGGYQSWLNGSDIAGADQLQDPLFLKNKPIGEGS